MESTPPARLVTGIPGFDLILEGGLVPGGVYIVQGAPGTGKTVMANQLCFHHADSGGSAVYFTLLTESHARMLGHLRRMRFFRPEVVGDRLHYLAGFKVLEEEGLSGLAKAVRNAVVEYDAKLVILDGLITAGELAPSITEFKQFVHEVQTFTANLGTTVLMLSSTAADEEVKPEHTIVDGIIQLSDDLSGLRSLRHVQIRKQRGAAQVRGRHTVVISDDGMTVHPRFESLLPQEGLEASAPDGRRMSTGIADLDAMLGGGVPGSSLSLLAGPSGCGKTILALQFLAAGVAEGERALYFGFAERPQALIAKCRRLGIALPEGVERGLIELIWERPIEGVLDVLAAHLIRTLRDGHVTRLCIDGLHSLQRTVDFPERTRAVLGALGEELERLRVTTLYTLEMTKLLGPEILMPIDDISLIAHNVLLMRYREQAERLERTLAIVKMRDSDYDSRVVELEITGGGISIASNKRRRSS